jgi:hypothetical protein
MRRGIDCATGMASTTRPRRDQRLSATSGRTVMMLPFEARDAAWMSDRARQTQRDSSPLGSLSRWLDHRSTRSRKRGERILNSRREWPPNGRRVAPSVAGEPSGMHEGSPCQTCVKRTSANWPKPAPWEADPTPLAAGSEQVFRERPNTGAYSEVELITRRSQVQILPPPPHSCNRTSRVGGPPSGSRFSSRSRAWYSRALVFAFGLMELESSKRVPALRSLV